MTMTVDEAKIKVYDLSVHAEITQKQIQQLNAFISQAAAKEQANDNKDDSDNSG